MSSLFDKLNTLVRARVRGVLGDDPDRARRRAAITPDRLGDVDREVARLRESVNAALDDEERQQAVIDSVLAEAADLDQQADAALARGDDAVARQLIGQMQLKQQQATMLQADLEAHRRSTAELISRVNEMEAVVAEARRQQAQNAPDADAPGSDTGESITEALGDRLRRARELVTGRGSDETAGAVDPANTAPEDAPGVVDEQAVNDDLDRRRRRLSG